MENQPPQQFFWYNPAELQVAPIADDGPPNLNGPQDYAMQIPRVGHLAWFPPMYQMCYEVKDAPNFSQEELDANPGLYSMLYLHNLLAHQNRTNATHWAEMFRWMAPWLLHNHTGANDDNTRLQLTKDEVQRIRTKKFPIEINPAPTEDEECMICCTNIGRQRRSLRGPRHKCRFCRYCFKITLQTSMKVGQEFPGRCCDDGSPFSLVEAIQFGDRDLILLFRHCMIKKLSLPLLEVPCFHCGEDIEAPTWNVRGNGQGQCSFCLHSTCICGQQTHSNNYLGPGGDRPCWGSSLEAQEARLDQWREFDASNSVPCPHCGFMISRTEGCIHLKCSKCMCSFCQACSGAWGTCACRSLFVEAEFSVPIEYRVGNKPGLDVDERLKFAYKYPIHCTPQFGDQWVRNRFPIFDPLDRYWGRFHWKREHHANIPEQRAYFIKNVMPRDARDTRLGLHDQGDMLRLLPRRSRWRVRTTHMIFAFMHEHAVDPGTEHRIKEYPGFMESFDVAERVLEELFQAGRLEGEPCDTSDLPLEESKTIPDAKTFALANPYIEWNLRKTKFGRATLKNIVHRIRQHNKEQRGLALRLQDAATRDRHARAYDDHISRNQRIAIQDYFDRYDAALQPYDPATDELPFPPSPLIPYNPSLEEVRRGFTGVDNSEQRLMRRTNFVDNEKIVQGSLRREFMDNEFDHTPSGHISFPLTKPYIPGESDHDFDYDLNRPRTGNAQQWAQHEDPQDEWRRRRTGR